MSLSRRMFGRIAAAAPLAGRSLVADHAKTGALAGWASPPVGNGASAELPDPTYHAKLKASKWLRDLIQEQRERREQDVIFREGPFEPDLSCLRSCSYAAKVAWQRRRDAAFREQGKSWGAKLASMMGWEQ